MTFNPIKIFLMVFVASNFLSCKGQSKAEIGCTEAQKLEIGKTVFELDNQIWDVFQDNKGDYWFGSNGKGIYHFNGKVLKQITTDDGLIDNAIRGVQEDHLGNIFIETPKGVSKFDGKNFTNLDVIKSPDNEWKMQPNDLWFNCNGNANNVYRYDGKNLYELKLPEKAIKEILGIDENEIPYSPYTVFGIDKDRKGNIWFGTVLSGAFRFDGKSFLWIGEKELSRLDNGREPGVRSVIEDRDGNIWLSNLISKYKVESNSTSKYEKLQGVDLSTEVLKGKTPYFNSGLTDDEGNLWITTHSGGVWKYDGETLSNFEIKNEEETVLLISIYKDNNGTIWLGTSNAGAYKHNGENFEKFEI